MRINRIYHSGSLQKNSEVILDKNAAHHVATVLRLTADQSIHLFNGDSCDYPAVIRVVKKQQVICEITDCLPLTNESPANIHLGQAISRSSKMDIAIQKAVELGVNEITPIIAEFSQVKLSKELIEKKLLHWQHIIISACEQSGRAIIPVLHSPVYFHEWIMTRKELLKFILHPYKITVGAQRCCAHDNTIQSIALIIGPEGGFSDKEVDLAQHQKFHSLQLGPRILRTETAALAAITLLQERYGDFDSLNTLPMG